MSEEKVDADERERRVHMAHCNQGDYEGGCKYGEDDTCPALQFKPDGDSLLARNELE